MSFKIFYIPIKKYNVRHCVNYIFVTITTIYIVWLQVKCYWLCMNERYRGFITKYSNNDAVSGILFEKYIIVTSNAYFLSIIPSSYAIINL